MLRSTFDSQIQRLEDELLILGSMVEKVLVLSVDALVQRNLAKAWEFLAEDDTINRQYGAIETETVALMITQQPVAGDLRALAAMLDIAAELARMGELAAEINELSLLIGSHQLPPAAQLGPMVGGVRTMLRLALTAFVERDVGLARSVPEQDDAVDGHYRRLCQSLRTLKDAAHDWEPCLHLLKAAHHLERAADRVVNICEWVVYAVTGELVEFDGAMA